MGSLVSSSIISTILLIASITAYLNKPKPQQIDSTTEKKDGINVSLDKSSIQISSNLNDDESQIANIESLSEQKQDSRELKINTSEPDKN